MDGRQVLMFWYRNQIYAIEARSPAEGAYSEGFIKAKFTQASDAGPACIAVAPPASPPAVSAPQPRPCPAPTTRLVNPREP